MQRYSLLVDYGRIKGMGNLGKAAIFHFAFYLFIFLPMRLLFSIDLNQLINLP